jgi:hypothetical protein
MSKVINLLKRFYSSHDSSVLCMNVLHHNVLFISLVTDPLQSPCSFLVGIPVVVVSRMVDDDGQDVQCMYKHNIGTHSHNFWYHRRVLQILSVCL